MKKKLFAVALAAVMVVSSAVSAMAESIADVNASGWWVAHSKGVEITEAGVEISYKSTTDATATANWNAPIYVVYSADAAFAPADGAMTCNTAAGYAEYWVMRADNYGWAGAGLGAGNTASATDLETLGVGFENNAADKDWTNWVAENQAGVNGKVTAKKTAADKVEVTFDHNGVKSTCTIPVPADKTIYVSLSGELCTLTNITAEAIPAGSTTPTTGDMTAVLPVAVLAVAAMAVVVVMKRRTVAE